MYYTLDEEVFNFENTNLDDIETFYITISNGEKNIALYKKNYAINVLRRGKTIFFTKHNENIDELKIVFSLWLLKIIYS